MIKIGTSGFSFPDWKGTVYPKKIKPSEMLPYYEDELGFEVCELNFTYYRMPDPYTMEKLALRTGREFEFTVKGTKEMTHEIWEPACRQAGIRERTTLKETGEVFKAFARGIAPLASHRKLGAVLLQFPTFFPPTGQNLDYLDQCRQRLKDFPLVIEFRNADWLKPATHKLLQKENLGICVVDEPQLPRLLPFEPAATSELGYFRFHGRNKLWYSAGPHQRYDYFYSKTELKGLFDGVKAVAAKTKKTYAFFNNCFMGQSAKNAAQMRDLLKS